MSISHDLFLVSPESCLNNCSCYYSLEHQANIYNCSSMNLTALPPSVQPGTNWLAVPSNNLTSLCMDRSYLSDLQYMDFSTNSITKVCDSFLQALKQSDQSPITLNLSNNNLTSLPKAISNMNFSELHIGHNPYHCDCLILWMRDWLIRLSTSHANPNFVVDCRDAVCHTGEMMGTPVYFLDQGKMGCSSTPSQTLTLSISLPALFLVITVLIVITAKYMDAIKFLIYLKFDVLIGSDDVTEDINAMEFDAFVTYRLVKHHHNYNHIRCTSRENRP